MKRLPLIITGLSVAILFLSLNRLTTWTAGYLQPYDFLRWLDFNAMLPIPLMSILLYFLLFQDVVRGDIFVKTRRYLVVMLVFITGVYLFGASSGTHEVTNYLNTRFCDAGKIISTRCNIIAYNDDEFSHWIYYLGFILMNMALMLAEYQVPRRSEISKTTRNIIAANAVFIGLGIFANLAFEDIGIDLYFFGSMMALALVLLSRKEWKISQQPVLFYFALSYSLGVIGTLLYKIF